MSPLPDGGKVDGVGVVTRSSLAGSALSLLPGGVEGWVKLAWAGVVVLVEVAWVRSGGLMLNDGAAADNRSSSSAC